MGFGKDGRGSILVEEFSTGVGALAVQTGVRIASGLVIEEDFRMIKTTLSLVLFGFTTGQGNGLKLFIVNGNLTQAEIEEAVEANGPLDRNDRTLQERSERFVKALGMVEQFSPTGVVATCRNKEGGPMIEETIRWTFSDTDGWAWFLYNTGATLTTGATVVLQAKHFGVWLT